MFRDIDTNTTRKGDSGPGRNVVAVIGIDRYRRWPGLSNAVSDARGALNAFQRLGFQQVTEPLLNYEEGGTAVVPALAETYEPNADLTEWTFHLRKGVKFHDGTTLTANDVVATLDLQWDAKNPLHKGNTGAFDYWSGLFGTFLNAPPS